MLPSGTDLTYFIEIASTQNLSRAAERLGLSQPSLSLAMRRLEASIGAPILIRNRSGVQLTPSGRALLAKARFLLQEWEKTREQCNEAHTEAQGELRIGCHTSVALYSLGNVVPKLMMDHPKLELRLAHDLSRHITQSVISLKLDIGLVINPVRHPDLIYKKLCDDEVTLWKSSKKKSNESVLICDPDLMQVQHILKKLKRASVDFQRSIHSSSLEVIKDLASQGAGVGVLPTRVAQQKGSGLERMKGAPSFHDELFLIYRVENRKVKAVETLAERFSGEMFA